MTRELCSELVDGFADERNADAARRLRAADPRACHRQHPRRAGLDVDTFTGWVRDVLEFADDPSAVTWAGLINSSSRSERGGRARVTT